MHGSAEWPASSPYTAGTARPLSEAAPAETNAAAAFQRGLLSLETLQHQCPPCPSADTLAHQPSPAMHSSCMKHFKQPSFDSCFAHTHNQHRPD